MMKDLLFIGLGGGLGSIFRFLVSKVSMKFICCNFPIGTFIVNISGCFLIGILFGLSIKNSWLNESLKPFLIIGFCGGYTTFSAFSLENYHLFQEGNYSTLIVYVLASLLFGVLATWGGIFLIK